MIHICIVKSFLTIALGLIMMVHALSTSLLVLNYRVNMNFIIENFCENTDKPEMHCDGKCHLNKQIQQEENQRVFFLRVDAKDQGELAAYDEHNLLHGY